RGPVICWEQVAWLSFCSLSRVLGPLVGSEDTLTRARRLGCVSPLSYQFCRSSPPRRFRPPCSLGRGCAGAARAVGLGLRSACGLAAPLPDWRRHRSGIEVVGRVSGAAPLGGPRDVRASKSRLWLMLL